MTNHIPDTVLSPCAKPKGMHRAMAHYQALCGLKPVGPHRHLAASLLKNITEPCTTCGGTGLHGTYGNLGWRICPTCHGFGEVYRISLDELGALRQKVLAQYPDAAPEDWAPGHPIFCPMLMLANGLIIDGCPPSSHDPVQEELLPDDAGEAGSKFLPWEMCIRAEPSPQSAPRAPARPRLSWQGLRVLGKVIWRKLAA
jgi:hypothetical protein